MKSGLRVSPYILKVRASCDHNKERVNFCSMTKLQILGDNEPTLDKAPVIRAAAILLGYLVEHQPIGLTKTGAFQRKFVLWAAQQFQWPDFDLERYFAVSKIFERV